MKRSLAILLTVAFVLPAAPALAGGGHGYYGGRHYYGGHGYRGHRHRGHGHHGYGYAIAGALVGGLVIGHLLTRPAPAYAPPAPVTYVPPPAPVFCTPTTGTGYANGRPAEFGGTWCRDPYGRAYIASGSTYLIRYLD